MTNIDFSKSEQYILSIRLSADGFSFSIHHPQNEGEFWYDSFAVNASYSMTANIKKMIATIEAFKYTYLETNVLIDTLRFTSIPFDLFEDEQADELFYQNFQPNANEIILCNILGKSNVALLFGMDKHAHQSLAEHFPHVRIFACVSPLIELFAQKSKGEHCRKLYTHFRKQQMEVFAFDKEKLLLMNSFSCKQTTDQVYYLLYIWQQLGFHQEKDQLWLTGTINAQEELLTELNKFLRQVNLLPTQEPLPFDLQTLMTCE